MRYLVAFTVALYAIGFAFAALAAVRWPSVLLIIGLVGEQSVAVTEISGAVGWRELGLTFGLAYLMAAFCFYSTSTLLMNHRRGAVIAYICGVILGFPPFLLFDFEPGWWQTPDTFEQVFIFSGVMSLFLFGAIWELAKRRQPAQPPPNVRAEQPELLLNQVVRPIITAVEVTPTPPPKKRYRQPVPAAIARQRASFAYHGRKAKVRLRR